MRSASELKKQIGEMDDNSVRALILSAARFVGTDMKKAEALASDIPSFRRMLDQTDDARLTDLLSSL